MAVQLPSFILTCSLPWILRLFILIFYFMAQ